MVTSAAGLAGAAAGADVVILGEVHDNPRHHAFQEEAIETVSPSAIVFEMLTPAEAARVTPELAAQPEALEEELAWSDSGWPDFAMYYPLLAKAETVPIHGAEVPRDEARLAFSQGAAGVFAGDAVRFGLTEVLPARQQEIREAEQQAAHCNALPEDVLPGFVEAQRLRDAALAASALDALAEHGPPVVIVTGNGHARRDWGVPALLAIAAPEIVVVSVGQFEEAPAGAVPFDFWTVAEPAERPDPCEAFR
jgi:uncharacterized iron-regulated protein